MFIVKIDYINMNFEFKTMIMAQNFINSFEKNTKYKIHEE